MAAPAQYVCLTQSLAWVEYLKSHAARVYDGLRRDPSGALALGAKIMAGAAGQFALRDVYNQAWSGLPDRAAVVAAGKCFATWDGSARSIERRWGGPPPNA